MQPKRGRPFGSFKRAHPTRVNGKTTKTWNAYVAMLQRCYNPKAHNYAWYGAIGVSVCDRWRDKRTGYDSFVADVGVAPDGLTLGRIDNAKPYQPGNVEWQTWKQQAGNRRKVGPKPDPNSLMQKAKAAGIPYARVYQRVKLFGWSESEALAT